jgi:hypothetical protein
MALMGSILKGVVGIKKSIPEFKLPRSAKRVQKNQLLKNLRKARNTAFGKYYNFDDIYFSNNPVKTFQDTVPIFDYDKIHNEWWHRCLNNEADVCWPGNVKYFALSSGTSGAASKHLPITNEYLRSFKRASIRQILSLSKYELPDEALNKGFLMIGGSSHLVHMGNYYEGDLSGITAAKIPSWFQSFYKPGKKIAKERDWTTKIEMIVENAPSWDISIVVGVPAWIQIIIEKIIAKYKLNSIHDIWPNFSVFVHGGVAFTPYKKGFEKLLGRPIHYIENYLASEGFIAHDNRPEKKGMRMLLRNGIFYEFVPFTEDNFDVDGNIKPNAKALSIERVQEGKEYALVLSTNAGAWRYLIGDTIKFVDKDECEIIITGRTKHYISLVGEHLSVDNMNVAMAHVAETLGVEIPEYCVAGVEHNSLFAHHWYVGVNGDLPDADKVKNLIDEKLNEVNDDYKVERQAALKDVIVTALPSNIFFDYLDAKGKSGGQNKFPRVLKGEALKDWQSFVEKTK